MLFTGVADKVNFANRRLTDKKNLTSAVDNNSEESRLKHYSLYQSREPAYTKYQFFRPHSKGKNLNNWNGKPHLSNVPIAAILKLMMTGKFDVIANFARLEIAPTRKIGNFHQQPYVTLPGKSQYNFYPRPSAFSFVSQGYKPFKEMTYEPREGFANYLPQIAVGQPAIQDTVVQPVLQSAEPKGYAVSGPSSLPMFQNLPSKSSQFIGRMPEQVAIMTNSVLPPMEVGFSGQQDQVSFENMYHQYQKMQEKSENTEKSYSELSKLYDIMNALKALHTESNDRNQQISSENRTNRPAIQAIKNSSVPSHPDKNLL